MAIFNASYEGGLGKLFAQKYIRKITKLFLRSCFWQMRIRKLKITCRCRSHHGRQNLSRFIKGTPSACEMKLLILLKNSWVFGRSFVKSENSKVMRDKLGFTNRWRPDQIHFFNKDKSFNNFDMDDIYLWNGTSTVGKSNLKKLGRSWNSKREDRILDVNAIYLWIIIQRKTSTFRCR